MTVAAVIPARGGSKGLIRKNTRPFCGVPLVSWSIRQAREARGVDSVWVSSDDDEILAIAEREGAQAIRRPPELAADESSSESAWLHALDHIETRGERVELMLAMQPTSPIRESSDLERAVAKVRELELDSLLSCCEIEDFLMWRIGAGGQPVGVNYDYMVRTRRQDLDTRYLENGSFWIFRPSVLRSLGNRLGGKIGLHVMELHKMFQIDTLEDLRLCEVIMRGYGLDAR